MAAFRYRALGPGGKRLEGRLDAESEAAAVERVQRMGYLPLSVAPAGEGGGAAAKGGFPFRKGGLSAGDAALFARELATLLRAGQDLDRALRFVTDTASSARIRAVAADLRGKVRDGSALAAAFARHPASFSGLHVGLVRAGEASGRLGESLAELADLLERRRRLAASIRAALVYPALLVAATVASVVLLLTVVLPQFTPIFAEAGASLPAATRFVIGAGDLLRDYGVALVLAALAGFLLAAWAWRANKWRRRIERAFLRLPVGGTLMRQGQAARFTRTLGTLLANGVGLVAALGIAREGATSLLAAEAVAHAAERVKEGGELAAPLAASGIFPAQAVHLLELGSETGKLAEMCLRLADILDDEIAVTTRTLVSLLVPAVTIVMGVFVAGIIASLLLAMLSLNELPL